MTAARLLTGSLFAFILYLLIKGGVLGLRPTAEDETAYYAALGFLAGFGERFVPDVATTIATNDEPPEPAGETSEVLAQIPGTVQSSLQEALVGPRLVPWSGWISISLPPAEDRGPTGDGKWRLIPGTRYEPDVVFNPVEQGSAVERRVEVRGSNPSSEAMFSVWFDADDAEVRSEARDVRVRQGIVARVSVPLEIPARVAGDYSVWLHVSQLGRNVALIAVEATSSG